MTTDYNDALSRLRSEHAASEDYVTVTISGQLFGVPVRLIADVFAPRSITGVPLARAEVAGVLNLRGRILTVIDVRARLGFACEPVGDEAMAIGIEKNGEAFGLLVDVVGDVVTIEAAQIQSAPANLAQHWRAVSTGVYRLEEDLLVLLDVDRLLDFASVYEAA